MEPFSSPLSDPALKLPRSFAFQQELDVDDVILLGPTEPEAASQRVKDEAMDDIVDLPDNPFGDIQLQLEVAELLNTDGAPHANSFPGIVDYLSGSGPTSNSFLPSPDLLSMTEAKFASFVAKNNQSHLSLEKLHQLRDNMRHPVQVSTPTGEASQLIQTIRARIDQHRSIISANLCDKITAAMQKNNKSNHQSRGKLPDQARDILTKWFLDHWRHPYPTPAEREELAKVADLDLKQVHNFFINMRVRVWKPTLDGNANSTTKNS